MLTVAVGKSGLTLRRRPDTVIELKPVDRDKFSGSIGTVTFIKNAQGAVDAFSINQERVWDLRFTRR